jgi:hypothetical protein
MTIKALPTLFTFKGLEFSDWQSRTSSQRLFLSLSLKSLIGSGFKRLARRPMFLVNVGQLYLEIGSLEFISSKAPLNYMYVVRLCGMCHPVGRQTDDRFIHLYIKRICIQYPVLQYPRVVILGHRHTHKRNYNKVGYRYQGNAETYLNTCTSEQP